MRRRAFLVASLALPVLAACSALAPEKAETMRNEQTPEIAPGTNRDFSFTVSTDAPNQVWRLWTTPSTWGSWDLRLKSASMEGEVGLGSTRQIKPLSGPTSSCKVVSIDQQNSYAFATKLPTTELTVERSLNADRTALTHRVLFNGQMAFALARMFGPGFRKALPPTMRQLNALAEEV